MGVDVLVIDTAHGHQTRTLRAIEEVRAVAPDAPIVAGNVVTAAGHARSDQRRRRRREGRRRSGGDVHDADDDRRRAPAVQRGDGVRGRGRASSASTSGPTAACAIPRDVALALAAGAANVMFGSWLAGTYESAADTLRDPDGRLYKESFGMASNRAVKSRNRTETAFERARKELFEEGISTSRMYLDPDRPGVEDIIDEIVAGVRSACTYAGAATIAEFHERAVVGVQSAAGYSEGLPQGTSW